MKNKRTFLASLALGLFLMATVAPIVTAEDAVLSVDKTKIVPPGRKQK